VIQIRTTQRRLPVVNGGHAATWETPECRRIQLGRHQVLKQLHLRLIECRPLVSFARFGDIGPERAHDLIERERVAERAGATEREISQNRCNAREVMTESRRTGPSEYRQA